MEITIDNRRENFFPEQQRWHSQNPPSEYCMATVGGYDCFIKRQREKFSGWGLLVKAISEEQIRKTPKVLSIARDKDHEFYYFFTEKIEGMTIEQAIKGNKLPHINIEKLVNALFIAVLQMNQIGFWYSDLCKKNIFLGASGEYYLIDIDSTIPHRSHFHYNGKVSFEYPSILTNFSRTFGNMPSFNLSHGGLSGECVNQAELIAISVDIKHSFKIPLDRKAHVINALMHRDYGKDYVNVFMNLMNNRPDWVGTRKLLNKIIG
jgi:hypothetical protein